MKSGVTASAALVLTLGACAQGQPSGSESSTSVCAEPVAAVQTIGERLKTDAPHSLKGRSDAGALFNVIIDHAACFSSEEVGQAKQALADLNQPQSNVDPFAQWDADHANP